MKNAIQELNEHCQKVGIDLPTWEFTQLSVTPSMWQADVTIGEYAGRGEGQTKKAAMASAAKRLIYWLKDEEIWHDQLAKPRFVNSGASYNHGQAYRKNHKIDTEH